MTGESNAGCHVAVRFEDPGGLLERREGDAILRAHHAVIARVRGGAPEAAVAPGDGGLMIIEAGSAVDAVLLGIRLQTETREARLAPVEAASPRLQVVAGIGVTEAEAREVCHRARGGQVVASSAVHEAAIAADGAPALDWGEPGASGDVECHYDDALARLDEPFERMFAAEIRGWVRPYRESRGDETGLPYPERPDSRNELFGLALSGGGMRSAVFSLGVMQAMSRNGLLERVDYLSTVSGGSYAGTALTTLCLEPLPYASTPRLDCTPERFPFAFPRTRFTMDEAADGADTPAAGMPVHGNESPALHHVRGHARLLGQRIGLLSAYTWQMVARFLASTALLWALFLLPGLTLLGLIGIAVWSQASGWDAGWRSLAAGVALAAFVAAMLLAPVEMPGRRARSRRANSLVRWLQAAALVLIALTVVTAMAWVAQQWHEARSDWLVAIGSLAAAVSGSVLFIGLRQVWTPAALRRAAWWIVVAAGGYVLLVLLVLAWFWLLHALTDGDLGARYLLVLVVAVVVALPSLMPDPGKRLLNTLSLHGMYRSRIEATWVIGARPSAPGAGEVGAVPVWSRVWPRTDLTLGSAAVTAASHGPASPYPLVCTTLSFPGNEGDPKLLDRRGEAFVLAPLFSGSALTRWRPTEELGDVHGLSLGGAAAISGAAVSPNMGEYTSATLSVITTLFNARLGQWLENPRTARRGAVPGWLAGRPLLLYLKEMLGQASRDDGEVYLSDGGHFENQGLYELLRRRCKYIVAVAADIEPPDDGPLGFGNIGSAIRLARVDFGIEISMPALRPMLRDPVSGFVASYYSVGRIRYPSPGGHADEGVLVLVKSALAGTELPADVLSYWRRQNPGFPYDPTTDQQLDQPQFESYRQLGFVAGRSAFRAARGGASTADQFEALRATFDETKWWPGTLVETVRGLRGEPR
jgi:hypothetical protein